MMDKSCDCDHISNMSSYYAKVIMFNTRRFTEESEYGVFKRQILVSKKS